MSQIRKSGTTLDGRLSALPRSIRETAEDRQKVGSLKLCLKKIEEVIALTSKEDIKLAVDFRRLSSKARKSKVEK